MRRMLLFVCLLAAVLALVLTTPMPPVLSAPPSATSPQAIKTEGLYRFISSKRQYLLLPGKNGQSAKLPAGLTGGFVIDGVNNGGGDHRADGLIGHVPGATHQLVTNNVYMAFKGDDFGERYFYTTSLEERDLKVSGYGWHKVDNNIFNVITKQIPGTVPLYRVYQERIIAGHGNTARLGQDGYFYTTSEWEKNNALKGLGYKFPQIIGYVYAEPRPIPQITEPEPAVKQVPKIEVKPDDSGRVHLALEVKDRTEEVVQLDQSIRASYQLAINNVHALPKEAFQPLDVLPPNPCGIGRSNARLFAQIIWGRAGKDKEPIMRGTCVPLLSPQDLAKMRLSVNETTKGAVSLIQVIVQDRLTGIEHKSNVYPVGAMGVGKVLFSVGCKGFLGRHDDFLCTSKSGMAACENLEKQGKPIKCRMAN